MPLKYRTSAPPVTLEAVSAVERQIGIKLPGDYIQFLRVQNGGSLAFENKYSYAVPEDYPDPPLSIESFWPVEDLPAGRQRVQDAFGVNLLPVGMDNFGNYICLGVAAEQIGKVFFLDHELSDDETGESLVVKIADSFSEFVASLGPDEG